MNVTNMHITRFNLWNHLFGPTYFSSCQHNAVLPKCRTSFAQQFSQIKVSALIDITINCILKARHDVMPDKHYTPNLRETAVLYSGNTYLLSVLSGCSLSPMSPHVRHNPLYRFKHLVSSLSDSAYQPSSAKKWTGSAKYRGRHLSVLNQSGSTTLYERFNRGGSKLHSS
jgi:hypothetical protein